MHVYLNTEQAADYLGIKERKLYELIANGEIPCSKVTGKWLFPRDALDRWVEAGMQRPLGMAPFAAPPIIGGSHDALLDWAARRSQSGLALLSVGSGEGLARLARNEVAMAAIHLHAANLPSTGEGDANLEAVRHHPALADAVVIGFARREQGLLFRDPTLVTSSLPEAVARGLRFGLRQAGAGAQMLLEVTLAGAEITLPRKQTGAEYATSDDLAFAIKSGDIDCGIATRAVAEAVGLSFLPLTWERFDLVTRRRTYFEPGPQALLTLIRSEEFRRHAALLGGLDISDAGAIRLAR